MKLVLYWKTTWIIHQIGRVTRIYGTYKQKNCTFSTLTFFFYCEMNAKWSYYILIAYSYLKKKLLWNILFDSIHSIHIYFNINIISMNFYCECSIAIYTQNAIVKLLILFNRSKPQPREKTTIFTINHFTCEQIQNAKMANNIIR